MTTHDEDCECCKGGYVAFREKTERLIREHGVAVISTASITEHGHLPMSYTVGLADAEKAEIVVFGLPDATALALLNDAASLLRQDRLPLNQPVVEIGNLPLVFKPILQDVAAEYILQANVRAGRTLPAIQMVWPDPKGKFPWEPEFAKRFAAMQPALYQIGH